MWNEFIWLKIGFIGELLWTQWGQYGFPKRLRIYWLDEQLLAFLEGTFSMKLSSLHKWDKIFLNKVKIVEAWAKAIYHYYSFPSILIKSYSNRDWPNTKSTNWQEVQYTNSSTWLDTLQQSLTVI